MIHRAVEAGQRLICKQQPIKTPSNVSGFRRAMIHWTAEAGQRLMATDRDTVKRFRASACHDSLDG